MLTPEARALIAKGLGLLGTACVRIGETNQAEEVFRIGIQYAHDGVEAADLFRRLGEALLFGARPGEAIAPLRRAAAFGDFPQRSCLRSPGHSFSAVGGSLRTDAFGRRSKPVLPTRRLPKSFARSRPPWDLGSEP